ncbi:asparagine synthase-related protein [Streptomyces sp. NPDC059452]|uniref:asparagine synthase-related protein n=1 Tax=Streptomyces sp. NPDC059452 TaxID=3346835 RepID=UPI0036C8505C
MRDLVYAVRGGEVWWATDAHRLAASLGAAPDLEVLTARLAAGGQHWPALTAFGGVRRVPGGYGLLLRGPVPELIDVRRVQPAEHPGAAAEVFGQQLTAAVRDRVRDAHGRVGADLSGGVDSSTAVLLAAEAGQVTAVTYTDGFTSKEDAVYAARVAKIARVPHHVARGGEAQLPFDFSSPVPAGDEPSAGAANYTLDACYQVPAVGLPCHLTGHGGDVVLDGSSASWVAQYERGHRREAHRQVVAWARLRNQAPGLVWRAVQNSARLGHQGSLLAAASALEAGPVTPTASGSWSWCKLGTAASWLTDQGRDSVAALLRSAATTVPGEPADEFDQWSALRSVGADARAEEPMSHSLGIRPTHPFIDNRVVRAAFAVPPSARRGVAVYKPLLRAALPALPEWLTDRRSKGSFTTQRIAGLALHHAALHSLILDSPLVKAGLIDGTAAVQTLNRAARGQSALGLAELHQLLVTCWWLGATERPTVAEPKESSC